MHFHRILNRRQLLAEAAAGALALTGCRQQQTRVVPASAKTPVSPVRFTDITAAAGLSFDQLRGGCDMYYFVEQEAAGAALLDANGDGYLDICPASVQTVRSHIPAVQALRPVADTGVAPPPQEPLVYVTLGTVQQRPDLLREVVAGVAALPVRVLVAVGPHLDPGSMGEQPAHVRVEAWVDQAEVLSRCTAVVSHAGSGTFLGALARGLPQLCLPQGADQFRNAEGGVAAGAALALAPTEARAESVRAAVERVLTDDGLRSAAVRVAAEIAAMPAPDEVARLLAARSGRAGVS